MGMMAALGLSAMGIQVQRQRMDITSQNLANASSTRTPEGGPYQRKDVVLMSTPMEFETSLKTFMFGNKVQGVQITDVVPDQTPGKQIYDPSHPDADPNGFVAMPNVTPMQEMVDILSASKLYEANVTAFNLAKQMVMRTFEIGVA